jgi:hypothetical protein
MSATFKPLPPPIGAGGEAGLWAYLKRVYDVIRGIQAGKLNATTTVTLAAGLTSTTFEDERIGPASVILLMPLTAHAAGALGGLYVSGRTQGAATLAHANSADADKTFAAAIIG